VTHLESESLGRRRQQAVRSIKVKAPLNEFIREEGHREIVVASRCKGRRRAGELDTAGSEYHAVKLIEVKHCWFYLAVLLVVTCFSIDVAIEASYVRRILPLKDGIFGLNDQGQNVSLNYYYSQLYLWNGVGAFASRIIFDPSKFNTYNGKETLLLEACSNNQSYCHYPSTIRTVEVECEQMVGLLIDKRKKYKAGTSNISDLYQIYEHSFYLQVLIKQLEMIRDQMSLYLFWDMMAKFEELTAISKHILDYEVAISLIGLLVGSLFIWRMRQRYLQEVYMLSFLS
jgi:hypothetical protein